MRENECRITEPQPSSYRQVWISWREATTNEDGTRDALPGRLLLAVAGVVATVILVLLALIGRLVPGKNIF